MKHARRVAITYSALYGSVMFMMVGVIALNLNYAIRSGVDGLELMLFILQGVLLAQFGMFMLKSLLYYRRVKRNVEYS
ncbi:cation transporter-like permease [Virgibacillus natechei]|uniref:Cation transporter-like permease n=1 Tax=Virgibacillus natechei TaxID=1216297 RepID=A0ABS4IGA7_9BACI|nr:cation transporter-like permease [Virgibacillus natechei]